MKRNYNEEHWENVLIKGMPCLFNDMRIDRTTVPQGKFQYEVAGDDDSGGDPCRVQKGVMVNFFGTLICDQELPLGPDGVLWLEDCDFRWRD